MENTYLTYKKFSTKVEVEEILDVLKMNDVKFVLEDNTQVAPSVIVGKFLSPEIRLKIKQDDFLKVDKLVENYFESSVELIDKDHYLFSFTDEELYEIINRKDEWSQLDYSLAKKILKERGIEINEKLENVLKQTRHNELTQKDKGSTIWTTFGYISAFLGGIIGIAIGLSLWRGKKTLPTGERIFIYDKDARAHGVYITIIGILFFIVYCIISFKTQKYY
ncbi:MAG: hypothetical protein K9J13_13465 [Saprospiraceae bacterium]|nr:hypothetical protein [Saprospiraceae bacterium]